MLKKSGAPVQVIALDYGDWDMHAGLGRVDGGWMRDKLTELSSALAAFATDLGGAFASTTLVTLSEFGRRVGENASGGLDHGHGNAVLLLGGGVVGGRVHGTWPGLGADRLVDGDLAGTTDYRSVIGEVLQKRCGAGSLSAIFPGFARHPPGGRPNGVVVTQSYLALTWTRPGRTLRARCGSGGPRVPAQVATGSPGRARNPAARAQDWDGTDDCDLECTSEHRGVTQLCTPSPCTPQASSPTLRDGWRAGELRQAQGPAPTSRCRSRAFTRVGVTHGVLAAPRQKEERAQMRSVTTPLSRRALLTGGVAGGLTGAALLCGDGAASALAPAALQVGGSTRTFALGEHPSPTLLSTGDLAVVGVDVEGGHMVGVTFPSGASTDTVSVRVRPAGGDWTAWSDLPLNDSEPDPDTAEGRRSVTGSDPLWVGALGAATVQVRLPRVDVADAHLHLVDAGESSALATRTTLDASTSADAGDTKASPQRGPAAGDPLPRGLGRRRVPAQGRRELQRHHQGRASCTTPPTAGPTACPRSPSVIRGMYRYHTVSLGWADLGYNFVVDRFGGIWEGRAGGITQPVVGAHAGGFNADTFGVSMMGDFTSVAPSAECLESVAQGHRLEAVDVRPARRRRHPPHLRGRRHRPLLRGHDRAAAHDQRPPRRRVSPPAPATWASPGWTPSAPASPSS